MVQYRSLLLASEAFNDYLSALVLDGKISEKELKEKEEDETMFSGYNEYWR